MAEGPAKIVEGAKKHKKVIGLSALGGVGLFGLYALTRKKSSGSSAQSAGQYLTPDQLVASPTGSTITLGSGPSGGTGTEVITPPGSAPAPGGTGASQVSAAPVSTPSLTAASLLGFTNANTPVSLVGGKLIDTGTGRVAYYGPNGQPGSANDFSGAASWTDPTGKQVYYNPTGYNYSDTTRHPDTPPSSAGLAVGTVAVH